ncbi:MAG: succinyl-diaminopimelate desuccinylase [Pseudomonadota bacterium]|jgi:succinyl-diaminopimelate desuccinylase
MTATLELAKALIARPSISPDDLGCQELLARELATLGFHVENMRFGAVDNFWARRGTTGPVLCFAGHTDVVPAGNRAEWNSDPFTPTEKDGFLYGRGAADMKGSIAAMVVACHEFIAEHPDHSGSIAFLITSDEESTAVDGTRRVIETLEARNEKIDWCIVGEPSSVTRTGDMIKNGRRGSLNGVLKIKGQQGHVAYPERVRNPIHAFLPALAQLCALEWDQGNQYFPRTSFQISNINAGTGANNVIPGEMEVVFNLRFSSELTAAGLKARTEQVIAESLGAAGVSAGGPPPASYSIEWQLSGNPFLTPEGRLVAAARASIRDLMGIDTELSTSGGTSDGRFIAPTGAQVVELGPVNATIHKVNERVEVAELDRVRAIYRRMLEKLLLT